MAGSGTGENLASVMARALGAGVSTIPGAMDERRKAKLDQFTAGLQLQGMMLDQQQAQRQAAESQLNMALGRNKLKLSNMEVNDAAELSFIPAPDRPAYQFKKGLELLQANLGTLQGLQVPQGGGLQVDIPGFGSMTKAGAPFEKQFAPRAETSDQTLLRTLGVQGYIEYQLRLHNKKADEGIPGISGYTYGKAISDYANAAEAEKQNAWMYEAGEQPPFPSFSEWLKNFQAEIAKVQPTAPAATGGFGPDGSFPTQEEYEDAKRMGLVE